LSLYNTLARHVLAPSLDRMRGTSTMKCLAELEKSQWWPRERIEELQSERLHKLIEHAYSNVPYYRRVMVERGLTPLDIASAADLAKLPVLTKDLIRANLEEMCSEGPLRNRLVLGHTSGSTGSPLTFYGSIDERRAHGLARAIRAREWAGVRLGDRSLHIHLQLEPLPRRRPVAWLKQELKRVVDVDTCSISENTLPGIIERMKHMEPFYLGSYPSIVFFIASFIRDSGLSAPRPLAVITGGEQLLHHQRELITDVFGTEPYSKYSSFENWEIASECPSHSGMHVNAEDILVELADEGGIPTPGARGGGYLSPTFTTTECRSFAMRTVTTPASPKPHARADEDCRCSTACWAG
jgi:phenylacetate-CoA ligase